MVWCPRKSVVTCAGDASGVTLGGRQIGGREWRRGREWSAAAEVVAPAARRNTARRSCTDGAVYAHARKARAPGQTWLRAGTAAAAILVFVEFNTSVAPHSIRSKLLTVFLHLKGQKFRGDARLLCARYPRHQVQRARHQGAYSARLAPSTAAPDVVCLLGRGCGAEAALRTPEAATRESA